jgi:hypothetical protein
MQKPTKLPSGATISKDRQTMFIDPRAGVGSKRRRQHMSMRQNPPKQSPAHRARKPVTAHADTAAPGHNVGTRRQKILEKYGRSDQQKKGKQNG